MTAVKRFACMRCGIAVHHIGGACQDCAESDALLVIKWRSIRTARKRVTA